MAAMLNLEHLALHRATTTGQLYIMAVASNQRCFVLGMATLRGRRRGIDRNFRVFRSKLAWS